LARSSRRYVRGIVAKDNRFRLDHLRDRACRRPSRAARARYRMRRRFEMAVESTREQLEVRELRRLLVRARAGRETCADLDDPSPLVSIVIPTYDRGPLLAERSIASATAQTYSNIEILVVGDACDEATAAAALSSGDERVRFVNLDSRGRYPEDPEDRWCVAGAAPMNAGLRLARGSWIAPCDDDDELTEDHVEVLLAGARQHRAEMVYSRTRLPDSGPDVVVGSEELRHADVCHGSVLYAAGLRFVPYSLSCWRLCEPADWNRWRRMRDAGVKIAFVPAITYVHYEEARHRSED
jgi:hypothetical protein